MPVYTVIHAFVHSGACLYTQWYMPVYTVAHVCVHSGTCLCTRQYMLMTSELRMERQEHHKTQGQLGLDTDFLFRLISIGRFFLKHQKFGYFFYLI